MPHISRKNIAVEKPHIVESEELENWGPYHNALSPLKEDQQPANARSVRQAFAGLTEIIHDSQDILYEPRDGALSQKMLAVYRKYLDWYADLPSVLRLGINSTPSVLFTQLVLINHTLNLPTALTTSQYLLPLLSRPLLQAVSQASIPQQPHCASRHLPRSRIRNLRSCQVLPQIVHSPPHTLSFPLHGLRRRDYPPHLRNRQPDRQEHSRDRRRSQSDQ